jgi:hypothetical protein
MNDFNQSETQLSLGFEEYPNLKTSVITDFNQIVSKKVETIKDMVDPYQLIIKKKDVDGGEVKDNTPKQTWPEKDIKLLDDFCKEHGIVGFNCGRMSPIAALAFLKQRLGIADGPLKDRIPYGYQKIGLNSSDNSFTNESKKKTLLNG